MYLKDKKRKRGQERRREERETRQGEMKRGEARSSTCWFTLQLHLIADLGQADARSQGLNLPNKCLRMKDMAISYYVPRHGLSGKCIRSKGWTQSEAMQYRIWVLQGRTNYGAKHLPSIVPFELKKRNGRHRWTTLSSFEFLR